MLDSGAAETAGYQVGDEVTVIAPSGDSVEGARQTFTMAGTAEFNGGGTAGATLLIFSTEGAQEVFLGGKDVFTSVALTAAPGVTQQQLADAAEEVLPDVVRGGQGGHGREGGAGLGRASSSTSSPSSWWRSP